MNTHPNAKNPKGNSNPLPKGFNEKRYTKFAKIHRENKELFYKIFPGSQLVTVEGYKFKDTQEAVEFGKKATVHDYYYLWLSYLNEFRLTINCYKSLGTSPNKNGKDCVKHVTDIGKLRESIESYQEVHGDGQGIYPFGIINRIKRRSDYV